MLGRAVVILLLVMVIAWLIGGLLRSGRKRGRRR
jgi:hypothetical protein